jgi:general secretion pathway protein F
MSLYRYKAVTTAGTIDEGSLEATSRDEAVGRLQAQGNVPIRVEKTDSARAAAGAARRVPKLRRANRALTGLIHQFATLLHAGLPLDRVLDLTAEQAASTAEAEIVKRMADRIRSGASLGDAMADEPLFPPFCVAIVRAGEAAGSLETSLTHLGEQLEKSQRAREKVQSALIYPIIVTVACALSLVFLFSFVVPRFAVFFENTDAAVPTVTRLVIATGNLFQQYGWTLPVAAAAVFLLGKLYLADAAHRRAWSGRLLALPLLGSLIQRVDTAQFARVLGTLLKNGVALTRALDIARTAIRNPAIAGAVDDAAAEVKEGRGLTEPLAKTGRFPRLALRLLKIGEETARLDDMLIEIAEVYDREIERDLERGLALLTPAITILLGAVVALVVGSILVALLGVYQLAV